MVSLRVEEAGLLGVPPSSCQLRNEGPAKRFDRVGDLSVSFDHPSASRRVGSGIFVSCFDSQLEPSYPARRGLILVMSTIHTLADLRLRARRRLPRAIFDFVDGGAGEEHALRRNEIAFGEVRLVPRILQPCVERDLSTRLLGMDYDAPFGVSPMGLGNLAWPGTDDALAMAAAAARIPYALSTAGSATIERIAELGGKFAWFQLYLGLGDEITRSLLKRAEDAGVETLVLTVDAAHPSRRLRNDRSGFGQPFRKRPLLMLDYALHPRWSLSTLAAGKPGIANLVSAFGGSDGEQDVYLLLASMARAKLDWESLDGVRKLWPGTLLVKGVLDPLDAGRMAAAGVDGVIVSNHGGRQLASAASPLDVLPAIRAKVGPDYPLLLDGGVRSGEDVAKAIILGADFVLLGRPFLYAAAALGPVPGASRVIGMLKAELSDTMAQLGCANIGDLTGELLYQAQSSALMPSKTEPGGSIGQRLHVG